MMSYINPCYARPIYETVSENGSINVFLATTPPVYLVINRGGGFKNSRLNSFMEISKQVEVKQKIVLPIIYDLSDKIGVYVHPPRDSHGFRLIRTLVVIFYLPINE